MEEEPSRCPSERADSTHLQTDVYCLHDYTHDNRSLYEKFDPFAHGEKPYDWNYHAANYAGEPVMPGEYGGISCSIPEKAGDSFSLCYLSACVVLLKCNSDPPSKKCL